MAKMQTQNVLALSVAALVASGVAAFAGVATFNKDLAGKAMYLAQEGCSGGCPQNQWCDYAAHSCRSFDSGYGNDGTSGGTSGGTSPSTTTSGPVGLNCAGGSLTACQASCVKDGVTNQFCMGYCAQECPSTSTTTSTSTAVTVTNRCAYVTEGDGCMAKCTCYMENTGSCSSPKAGEAEFCNAVKSTDAARTGKTGVFSMTTCSNYCDELKAAALAPPPPAPIVEPAPAAEPAPVATQIVQAETTTRPAAPEEFKSEDSSFDGDSEDSGDFEDFGGPGDFGPELGPPMDDFGSFEDEFGYMPEEGDFDDYFMGYGPSMGGEFDEGFGGGFGEIPEWEREEMLHIAENFCPDFVERIEDAETPEELFEEIGMDMQMECGGGDMGEGGPPDPEMMENAAKLLSIFPDKDGPVYFALNVAQKHNVFTDDEVKEIEGILGEIGDKASEAEEACNDLPEPPDMMGPPGLGEEDDDLFGLNGFLAQLVDDEEEGDGEESDDFGGGGESDEIRKAYEACGSILDEVLGPGPGQEEKDMGESLMGRLEGVMRTKMEAAGEDGTIPEKEMAEVEEKFQDTMKELGLPWEEEGEQSNEEEVNF